MLPYFIVYLLVLTMPIFLCKSAKWNTNNEVIIFERNKKYVFFISCILIFLFGLRHQSMGIDLKYGGYGYLSSFDTINTYSWFQIINLESFLNYEKGYVILNKLIGSVILDRQFLLFSCAAITIIPVGYTIASKSKDPMLSFIIYMGLPVFVITFSGLRQAIALSITFFSIRFIQKRKFIFFVFIIFFAYFFHSSSILFLIAYPVYYIKKGTFIKLITLVMLPICFICRTPLFNILSKILKDNAVPDNNGAITLLIVFCLIYIFSIVFGNHNDKKINGYTNLFYISCLCQIFGGIYSTAVRVGYYFMIFLSLLLPDILEGIESSKENAKYSFLIKVFIILAFVIFGLQCLSRDSWYMSNPYIVFWE